MRIFILLALMPYFIFGCDAGRHEVNKMREFKGVYKGSVASWDKFLSCWDKELKGIAHRKYDFPLFEIHYGNNGSNIDISALEKKYGPLPASYKDFLLASGGVRVVDKSGDYIHFDGNIGYLKKIKPDIFVAMNEGRSADAYADAEYYNYSASQNHSVRPPSLSDTIFIGDIIGDGVVLINNDVVFSDGESEIIFSSWRDAGDLRYKSFAEFMTSMYFETTKDHLYMNGFYSMEVEDTCAKYIYDSEASVRVVRPQKKENVNGAEKYLR